jgi:hypothetical protein
MSQLVVLRIWRAFDLKPYLVETWKLSTDLRYIESARDAAGLYLAPSENALSCGKTAA